MCSFQNRVLAFKPISPASHSDNPFGVAWVLFYFLPKPSYMHIYCTAIANEVPTPNAFKDKLAREHLSFVFCKENEQFIFLRFEGKRFVMQRYFAAREVDDEVPEFQFLLLLLGFV